MAGDAGARVLAAVRAALDAEPGAGGVAVAFSGGRDSRVLLEALARAHREGAAPAPRALHVDHGLSPDSGRWAAHCAQVCAGLRVPFEALRVDARPAPGESPEAAARRARYAALAPRLAPGEILATAHHADDQAETVLLALLRGSGPRGLAGIAPGRPLGAGRLLRPLLGLRRDALAAAARAWSLEWVEDPANRSVRHPRNRLRAEVLPLLETVAPGAVTAIARSARLQADAAQAVAALAALDLAQCGDGEHLSRRRLRALDSERRRAVLRLWLERRGLPLPGAARLFEAERQLVTAAASRAPCVRWPGGELRVYGDAVHAAAEPPPDAPAGGGRWLPPHAVRLATGRLWAEPDVGAGLRRGGGELEVGFRRGGERCRPAGRRHGQTLKRLLQEHRVAPWMRAGLPLLWRDGELVAVADLWVCAGHEAGPGEPGWRIRWRPGDAAG